MKKLQWTFIPDYRKSEYLDQIDLVVCYSGKRYIAVNVRHMTISTLEAQIPLMIKELKKDMRDERAGRKVRRVRRRNTRR